MKSKDKSSFAEQFGFITIISIVIIMFICLMTFTILEEHKIFTAAKVERARIMAIYDKMADCSGTLSSHWNHKTSADIVIAEMDSCIGTKEWQEFKIYRNGKESTMAETIRGTIEGAKDKWTGK